MKSLLIIQSNVSSEYVRCLVHTGCSTSLVQSSLLSQCEGICVINEFDGQIGNGNSTVKIQIAKFRFNFAYSSFWWHD